MKRIHAGIAAINLFILQATCVFAQEKGGIDMSNLTAEQKETLYSILKVLIEYIVKYSFQALGGVIVLFLAWIVAKYVARFITPFFAKHHIDVTVSKFLVGGIKLMIMVFAGIVALGKFGIEIAPFIAGISVIGFGTSFALQGPLSNYASGIVLIFTKPFKVGDIIEVANVIGEVTDVKLARTDMKTVDGNLIVVPNRHIIGEIIHNYSTAKRLDLKIGVGYNTDVYKAIEIIKAVVKNDPRITYTFEPQVGIADFADSGINIMARVWCKQDDYWKVLFDINLKIFDELKRNNIDIPFPQMDVHLYKEA
jgi:small conductance mechanosensitive channel